MLNKEESAYLVGTSAGFVMILPESLGSLHGNPKVLSLTGKALTGKPGSLNVL